MVAVVSQVTHLHAVTERLPSSSTAGLMEAVLTYNTSHEEDLGADDRDITPTPGNVTAGMDIDNNPSPVICCCIAGYLASWLILVNRIAIHLPHYLLLRRR
jgi:hypothetical protein